MGLVVTPALLQFLSGRGGKSQLDISLSGFRGTLAMKTNGALAVASVSPRSNVTLLHLFRWRRRNGCRQWGFKLMRVSLTEAPRAQ